jgi:hypothetical protein
MQRIITRWIVDLKLDGFMFDAPDAELGAGIDGADHSQYNPALIRQSISGVIRNVSGDTAFAFAEIYSDPPLMDDLGFAGEFADDKLCPRHSGKYCVANVRSAAIGRAVYGGNASMIEGAMVGPGSVDDLSAQPFRAPGTAFRASYLVSTRACTCHTRAHVARALLTYSRVVCRVGVCRTEKFARVSILATGVNGDGDLEGELFRRGPQLLAWRWGKLRAARSPHTGDTCGVLQPVSAGSAVRRRACGLVRDRSE